MRGGYRPNSGRKKGFSAKNAEEARKLLSERLAQEIEPIANVLVSEAKKGNIRAIKELFDRAWGRVPQADQIYNGDAKLPVPIMGLDISEEALIRFHFSPEERKVLEKRLIPKTEIAGVEITVRK